VWLPQDESADALSPHDEKNRKREKPGHREVEDPQSATTLKDVLDSGSERQPDKAAREGDQDEQAREGAEGLTDVQARDLILTTFGELDRQVARSQLKTIQGASSPSLGRARSSVGPQPRRQYGWSLNGPLGRVFDVLSACDPDPSGADVIRDNGW
jgi:hypothetical protein